MTILAQNLAAHAETWGRQPDIDDLPEDWIRLEYPKDAGSAAHPSLSCRLDGVWSAPHSDDNPVNQAREMILQAQKGRPLPALVGIVGVGLGYGVDLVLRSSDTSKVLAFEVDPALMRVALSARDWSDSIRARRLMFSSGPDFAGSRELWRLATPGSADPLLVLDPVLARVDLEAARTAARLVIKAHVDATANDDARKAFAGRYLLNTLANLPHLVSAPPSGAVLGARPPAPVVVVAAGPSLDATLPALATCRHLATVIAVDTALSPLLAAGIEPDFVVALDPAEANARHLLEPPMPAHAWLVAEGSVQPSVLERFARVVVFRVANHHPWPWLRSVGLDAPTFTVWGSVATAALDLALHLGGDPIVLLGLDLAYTGRQPYCRNTVYEADWTKQLDRGLTLREIWDVDMSRAPHIEMTDLSGAPVASTAVLISVRDWLVSRMSDCKGRRFINATGGGILHGGPVVVTELSEALAGFAPQGRPRVPPLRTFDNGSSVRLVDALGEVLEESSLEARETRSAWHQFGEPNLDDARLDAVLSTVIEQLSRPIRVE